jgi:L-iditol 2-dehydrogenase
MSSKSHNQQGIHMKALILKAPSRFDYTDVPDPAPGPGEVLISICACGICGSDVHGADGSTGRRLPPIIMGHEAAGTIARLGPNVTGWTVGDRATFDSTISCGNCSFCTSNLVNLCTNRRVLGVSCPEYRQNGAFAQYIAVPARILYRLPDSVSFSHAAMTEPLSIALHAVSRSPIRPDQTALVVGCGMIGLLVIQCLRAAGCRTITAVDIDTYKLQLAAQLGADTTIRTDPAAWEQIEIGEVDVAFEAVGIDSTVNLAVSSVKKGGHVVLVGNLAPHVQLPLQKVVTRQLSLFGSCASAGEYPQCLDMIASGKVDLAPLISAEAPLAEGAKWFAKLVQKGSGLMKVILVP